MILDAHTLQPFEHDDHEPHSDCSCQKAKPSGLGDIEIGGYSLADLDWHYVLIGLLAAAALYLYLKNTKPQRKAKALSRAKHTYAEAQKRIEARYGDS